MKKDNRSCLKISRKHKEKLDVLSKCVYLKSGKFIEFLCDNLDENLVIELKINQLKGKDNVSK